MATRKTPTRHHTLDSQVGGHAGVQASEDGSLIIKPCLPAERDFYQLIASGDERFEKLREWVPKFFGTLRLEGKVREGGEPGAAVDIAAEAVEGGKRTAEDVIVGVQRTLEPAPEVEDKESLVLENLSSSFVRPCILDIKLGTVLYDHGANEEKKARMIKAARDTTSLETGVRLTGFMVYDHSTQRPATTPKAYGKSIKPSDLPDGMVRFFPVATKSEDGSPSGQGLPRELLRPVLEGLIAEVKEIRAALAETELRMVGGSILVVYEADWDKAREGLENSTEREGANTEEDEDEDDDEDEESVSPPYLVRVIDFAHTRFATGEGPDEGVLLGLDTTIRLFEDRLSQLNEGTDA